MAKYKSKPVEIEAERFMGTHSSVIDHFVGGYNTLDQAAAKRVWVSPDGQVSEMQQSASLGYVHAYEVATLEGKMLAMPGDWIIKGIEGEFYPCKDSVFQRKYEAI